MEEQNFIRDLMANGIIVLKLCYTNEQMEILTKSLPRQKFILQTSPWSFQFESKGSFEGFKLAVMTYRLLPIVIGSYFFYLAGL